MVVEFPPFINPATDCGYRGGDINKVVICICVFLENLISVFPLLPNNHNFLSVYIGLLFHPHIAEIIAKSEMIQ